MRIARTKVNSAPWIVSRRTVTGQPNPSVVCLYRPTGPTWLAFVEASGWLAWPLRLLEKNVHASFNHTILAVE